MRYAHEAFSLIPLGIFGTTTADAVKAFNFTLKPVPTQLAVADAVTLNGLGIASPTDKSARDEDQDSPGFWEKGISYIVCILLCVFVLISAYYPIYHPYQSPRNLAIITLIILAVGFGIWFVSCFTGDPSSNWRRRETFRFAYVFTMTSFAVLLFPIANPWQPDVSGPIGIIRGCVDKNADRTAPDSIACVVARRQGDVILEEAPPVNGASLTKPNASDVVVASAPAGAAAVGASTPASAAVSASDAEVTKKGAGDVPELPKPAAPVAASDLSDHYYLPPGFEQDKSYPWLVVIGGTYGTHAQNKDDPASETKNEKADASSNYPAFTIVQSGFVVPYYVLLLAFVGGAISLTRRIPEYQKQSEPHYVGTADAPRLDPFEIRENVIFEIMQLITAPFIAMVAFYAFAPATTAGGITVSFLSGFASGVILLQLRGLAEGIAPALTARISAPNTTQLGSVSGKVFDDQNNPMPSASVSVVGVTSIDPVKTGQDGSFALNNVPSGNQQIMAAGNGKTATKTVNVSASANTSLTISLT